MYVSLGVIFGVKALFLAFRRLLVMATGSDVQEDIKDLSRSFRRRRDMVRIV